MKGVKNLAVLLGLCLSTACASFKVHQDPRYTIQETPTSHLEHRIFFVGDAGDTTARQTAVLNSLRRNIQSSNMPATVVFLGDNIYPIGLPSRKDSLNRKGAERILLRQVQAVADLDVEVYFIPGNHDWNKGHAKGLKSVIRQDDFFKDLELDNVHFLPNDGCPGPSEIDISDDCVLLLVDSQWWLQNWSEEKKINEKCDLRTRFDFASDLAEAFRDHKEKQVIMAVHHPIVSSGAHGGFFSFKDHLFPLTNASPGLYIPLPILGSLYPVYRSTFGNVQDQPHPKYREFIDAVEHAVEPYDNVIIVSGHEHGMEYHEWEGHHVAVSGSGSKIEPLASPPGQIYGHAAGGHMQMNVHAGGSVEMIIWEVEDGQETMAFRTGLTGTRRIVEEELDQEIQEDSRTDSTKTYISQEYVKSNFYQFLFGERYRQLYNLEVDARNLYLDEERGGLLPLKKGGGFQTNSLRMESPDEHQYVLRSLNKDASRLLPSIFQSTFANDILQDQFTASHPYAAFVIPEMADAAGIYHTNPELVYVPSQQALGRYSDAFKDDLYLYEERPAGDWTGFEFFGGSDDIVNFNDVIEDTRDDYRNKIDQEFVLRSRLFDMFIGDWDRHDDQWRWAEFKTADGKMFRPIPRDRDQALSDYDGLLLSLARSTPDLKKMTPFTGEIKKIQWFNLNARYFDRDFLNAMTRNQWVTIAKDLQALMTDDLISASLAQWPPEVYASQGHEIDSILKVRRDNLVTFATEYYDVLAEHVYIRGTDHADYLLIETSQDSIVVKIHDSNRAGEIGELYYQRAFYEKETDIIEIYGLDGRDHFDVSGPGKANIKVYLVGGEGKDQFRGVDTGHYGKIRSYDTHKRERGIGVKYSEVDDDFNTYERKSFTYNLGMPITRFGWNPDDGLFLGAGGRFTRYGFKKEPYASRHTFFGLYAFKTKAFAFGYLGEWKRVIGKAGVDLEAVYEGVSYVENYFGFGNDSEFSDERSLNYYRVRKRSFRVLPAITFGDPDDGHHFKIKVGTVSHRVDSTEDRFIAQVPDNGLDPNVFIDRRFVHSRIDYLFNSVDNVHMPGRGIRFHARVGIEHEFELEETHRFFETSLTMYYQLRILGQPTLATRIGAEWHGGDYQFYQAARLGAHKNFRGMFKHRLHGDRLFYQNIDLRYSLVKWRSYLLPAEMGIVLSFDHGRVWLDGGGSDTWHINYGGGLWISPFETLLVSLSYNISDLDERFAIRMGFFF